MPLRGAEKMLDHVYGWTDPQAERRGSLRYRCPGCGEVLPGQHIFTTTLSRGRHFRGRYQPQLGQHPKRVENTDVVRDEACLVEFEDVDAVDLEVFTRRRHTHKSAPVRARGFQKDDKLFAVRDHKLNREMQIGKGFEEGSKHSSESLVAVCCTLWHSVVLLVDAIGRKVALAKVHPSGNEQLGGFYLVEAADLDAALKIAKEVPLVGNGAIEIRPLLGAD